MNNFWSLIISAIITIVGSIVVSVITNKTILRKTKEEIDILFKKKYNEKRWDLYTEFITLTQAMISSIHDSNIRFHSFAQNLSGIGTKVMLISSDDVVKKYGSWRILSDVNGVGDLESLKKLFELINSMRIDLGNVESELGLDELLKTIVPNYRRVL